MGSKLKKSIKSSRTRARLKQEQFRFKFKLKFDSNNILVWFNIQLLLFATLTLASIEVSSLSFDTTFGGHQSINYAASEPANNEKPFGE